jgi:hypothetical protein
MIYNYSIYGITVSVPFPCSMLVPSPSGVVPDISITEGEVPRRLVSAVLDGPNWQAAPGIFLFRGGPRSGRFLIEKGERILFQRNPSADEEILSAHLITRALVAMMRQRGNLVLHANVVQTPRGCVAISGESGAGKSTAHAALVTRGCRMVADDIAVLFIQENGRIMVIPGISKMNLCEDAAIKLGHNLADLQRNPLRSNKVIVPVAPVDIVSEPVPLTALYLLSQHSGEKVNITRLTGADKLGGQLDCIYGPLFPEEHSGIIKFIHALSEQVEMYRIERPCLGDSVHQVVAAILNG